MGHENVGRNRAVTELAFQLMTQDAEACAAIEDVNAVAEAQLHAGGVASVAHVFGLWRGSRSTHAPEINPHSLKIRCWSIFDRKGIFVNWIAGS
jgi:hypothetical protein